MASTPRKLYTLIFVRKGEEILLGMKKRGLGEGKWNGFGGKVEPGETILEGAIRELKEECGLSATKLKHVGLLEFKFGEDPKILEVHVFETYQFHGQIIESDEMKPKWFHIDNIPFTEMWADDSYWFPFMLKNILFKGFFLYKGIESGSDKIVKYTLEESSRRELQHGSTDY